MARGLFHNFSQYSNAATSSGAASLRLSSLGQGGNRGRAQAAHGSFGPFLDQARDRLYLECRHRWKARSDDPSHFAIHFGGIGEHPVNLLLALFPDFLHCGPLAPQLGLKRRERLDDRLNPAAELVAGEVTVKEFHFLVLTFGGGMREGNPDELLAKGQRKRRPRP